MQLVDKKFKKWNLLYVITDYIIIQFLWSKWQGPKQFFFKDILEISFIDWLMLSKWSQ